MADDLRAALVEAKLAGTKAEDGAHAYLFRSNETAAMVALDVFARWLDEQSNACAAYAVSIGAIGRRPDDERYLARRLRDFSAHVTALTQPSTEESHDA